MKKNKENMEIFLSAKHFYTALFPRARALLCGHLGKDKAILRLGILRSPLSLKETSAPPPKLQLTVIQGALKKL